MSTEFRYPDRMTKFIFPESMDDWLSSDHLARFIVDIVDNLDIRPIENAYGGRGGERAYHPRMLLTLLFYAYATGVFSSRRIEKGTYDSVPFRYIAVNTHPDHDTISNFRKRFLTELGPLFTQILLIANEMGCLKMGTVSLDGTKIKANASKHSAYSYEHANKIEELLKKEVEELLARAEATDNDPLPDGLNIPAELKRRVERLEAITKAKEEIERRAAERYEMEREEYEKKMVDRQKKEEETGSKVRGRIPAPPEPGPKAKDQVNLTDEESRIMPVSGGGFEQCYNAQASVDTESMIIVTNDVTQNTNDKQEVEPTLKAIEDLPEKIGKVTKILADAGYYSEENVNKCDEHKIEPNICARREPHYKSISERFEEPKPEEESPMSTDIKKATPLEQMIIRMKTLAGRAVYSRRKCTIEPVFGVIKAVMGFRQFLLRGIESVQGEWNLVCIAWNLKRLHTLELSKEKQKN